MDRFKRLLQHLASSPRQLRRAFPAATLAAIERAIQRAEASHAGEIRFVVEHALDAADVLQGQTARARAIDVFARLRVWDTHGRNGVLIYLLMAERQIEIVADRGIAARVDHQVWASLCDGLEQAFRQGDYENGAVACIEAVAGHLQRHFPANAKGANELPDAPVVL